MLFRSDPVRCITENRADYSLVVHNVWHPGFLAQPEVVLLSAAYHVTDQLSLLGCQVISGQLSQYDFQLSPLLCLSSCLKCLVTQTHPPLNAKKAHRPRMYYHELCAFYA